MSASRSRSSQIHAVTEHVLPRSSQSASHFGSPLRLHSVPGAYSPTKKAASPIVKWVGGKSRLIKQLAPLLPTCVEKRRYWEPFFGGGAMYFALRPEKATLCDVNPLLVDTYKAVRSDVEQVLQHLQPLADKHDVNDSSAYYRVRSLYNSKQVTDRFQLAAMFIYLNKTCFNGLHRVNKKGEFNVPVGRYAKPKIFDADALRAVAAAFQNVTLKCQGFEYVLNDAQPGDFFYFDPPYEPVSRTASFTNYAQGGFSRDDQARLWEVFRLLDRRGCKLMLSNSDASLIRELYGNFRIDEIYANRAINSNASKRGAVKELVVRNY